MSLAEKYTRPLTIDGVGYRWISHLVKPKLILLPVVSALVFAALTWLSFQSSVLTGEPWDWQFPGVREQAGTLPDWFVCGQRSLLWRYGTIFTVAAAISGAVVPGFITRPTGTFSLPGRVAYSCPAIVLPLVGWFGMFSFLLFGFVAALALLTVLIHAPRRRAVGPDLASVPLNLLLLFCIFQFCGDWFSVYGD
jgi:hypothetical protein